LGHRFAYGRKSSSIKSEEQRHTLVRKLMGRERERGMGAGKKGGVYALLGNEMVGEGRLEYYSPEKKDIGDTEGEPTD